MCGFAGVYDAAGNRNYDIRRMLKTIYHRGPDEQKCLKIDSRIQIAFARLAVIGLEDGSQPMINDDASVILMCNGEIYNYLELRKELEQCGTLFRTKSDTEVLLKMYEAHGMDMLARLEGMFSVMIIDKRRQEVYLIRDRFGIKPLYYTCCGQEVYGFASEIRPLLRLPFVSKKLQEKSIADFLQYRYVHAPYTVYKDIKKVMPGHFIKITDGSIEEIPYWDCGMITPESGISPREHKHRVIELLRKSVNLHLRSDVKLGVFLSGGIDSGLLAAFASEQRQGIDTYTLKFENGGYDESGLAGLVAQRYHTNHHCHTVRADDFQRLLPQMLWYFDEPLGDSGILPNFMINQIAAKDGTKVVWSGAGGDELFAGYEWYFESRRERLINSVPGISRMSVRLLKETCPELSSKIERALLFYENSDEHLIRAQQVFRKDEIYRLTGTRPRGDKIKRRYMESCCNDPLNTMLYADIKTYLMDDLMLLADRSCMAWSVEGRVPFLYHPLVEYALTIPGQMKAQGGKRKQMLREIAQNYLPEELLNAPKRGFSSPIDTWVNFGFGKYAYRILNEQRSIRRTVWNPKVYQQYVADRRNYRKNFQKIYLLLVLEIFFRVHLDHDFDSAAEIQKGLIYG